METMLTLRPRGIIAEPLWPFFTAGMSSFLEPRGMDKAMELFGWRDKGRGKLD